MTVALRAQHRQGGACDVDDAEEVGLDLLAEFLFGHVLDGVDLGVAGVVDDDVEAAERRGRGGDGGAGGRRVGHVERDGAHVVAVLRDEVV